MESSSFHFTLSKNEYVAISFIFVYFSQSSFRCAACMWTNATWIMTVLLYTQLPLHFLKNNQFQPTMRCVCIYREQSEVKREGWKNVILLQSIRGSVCILTKYVAASLHYFCGDLLQTCSLNLLNLNMNLHPARLLLAHTTIDLKTRLKNIMFIFFWGTQ